MISVLCCLSVFGCAGVPRVTATSANHALLGDAWFEARSKQLAMSYDDTRARDRNLSDREPPELETLDTFTRQQGAAVWAEQCSKCHGLDGEPPEQLNARVKPRSWGTFGTSMGFFFGGNKMRAGLFRTISEGGKPREDGSASPMPAWGEILAREQIWALVYHLESF